jgi:lipoprotein-anchoring transpeptidase ErfK/SrfK
MFQRAATALVGVLAGSLGAGGVAWAQYYPPYYQAPPPYYRGAPPAPPAAWDIDDMPVGTVPGDYDQPSAPVPPAPRAGAAQDPYAPYRPPYGAPAYPNGARVVPGAVERDPYALPPPGVDYSQRPNPGQVVPGQVAPAQPGYAPPGYAAPGYAEPTNIRPPGSIGPAEQQVAALPPDIRPEVGDKELSPQLRRQLVEYRTREPAGTIIIDTPNTYLYLVLGNGQAMRYGIGVGREGFTWSGTQRIARMSEWPDWHPPAEMIERQPYLPRFMAGGPGNPLGARALYLGNTLYRIHGTNQPSTIGTFVSSGCIRLLNADIEDLYGRITVGTRVVVLPGGKQPDTAAVDTQAPPYRVR